MYHLISQLVPIITSSQGQGKIEGVLIGKGQDTIIHMGEYEFTFRHEYKLGWAPGAKNDEWPLASAILIQTAENEFFIAGTGVVVTFKSLKNNSLNTGILKVDEGTFENDNWTILRHLNGDQTHQGRHLHIPAGEYNIQKLRLYTYY
jgi:hypothetical protein